MKKAWKSLASVMLAVAMVLTTVMTYLPSLEVLAAPITKNMAHLKSGSGNANGHFGSNTPEAFILSDDADITDEDFSFTLKVGSTKAETRFRFVNKYVDDDNWSFIAYDGASGWLYQYENGGNGTYPGLSGLPALNQNDIVEVSGDYTDNGLVITVNNTTTGESGTATAADENFLALKDQAGKIGFGAGTYGTQYTDIYFADVVVGENAYAETDYSTWTLYNDGLSGQTWEPLVSVEVGDDGEGGQDPETNGRKWITVQGGSNNGGGHSYGNANATAPALLLDNDRTMPVDGTLSLTFRPVSSNNFGIFYMYGDDSNWLYIGYDPSSHWYYQYNLNGSGSYPQLAGLPDPVTGEEMTVEISLSREQLAVTVNGTRTSVSAPNLLTLAENLNGTGRFGVKTNGATKVEFADLAVNGTNCMEDNWVWCAERSGQVTEQYYTAVEPVSGTVTDADGEPIQGATVRFGVNATTTDASGAYAFDALEVGEYNVAATAPGYQAYEDVAAVKANAENVFDIQLQEKTPINLDDYDSIASDYMTVYVGKDFPLVARYVLNDGSDTIFRAQETQLTEIEINGTAIEPTDMEVSNDGSSQTYSMSLVNEDKNIDLSMTVKISVDDNDLTWEVTELTKNDGCVDIASIDIPQLNLVAVDAVETDAVFNGAKASNSTVTSGDKEITWDEGFNPSTSDGYLYAFLTNGNLSAGLWSNSEIEGDERVVLNSGADTMSLTSAKWYYEDGDANAQAKSDYDYPVSELPCAKVCIAGNINGDDELDWNDGALAFRDIMNYADGSEDVKNLVNYRIVMNFASMASNPYMTTADNIKKVYLATDGLPQAVMLKGYGSEGHDSANSEYAHIAEREGGVEDFQDLIKIAHEYGAQIGIHINAQESYPESKSFNDTMVSNGSGNGWGWLDQSYVIDKLWDLGSEARYKRLVQLYDRINETDFYSGDWDKGEYVGESEGELNATMEEIAADAATREDNMDFIYLDVWYQDSWETRRIAEQINSLGWRFTTEFPYEGEYDSTWSHWATDAAYGGNTTKGYNSEIIRFIRNDQRDVQVINYPSFGGAADNPLLGGFRLYGFEGWGGDQDFNKYIRETFTENLPTKFLQHYYVTDWEDYEDGASPTGNQEKQITLKNDDNDTVVVTRNEEQRSDDYIERTITLNDKVVLNDVTYLLPWTDTDTGEEKLYHWNLEGGTTTWDLQDDWAGLANVVVYALSDQGRGEAVTVPVENGQITLTADAETAYVILKGESSKTLKDDFGDEYVTDPGFNGYAGAGESLDAADWSGDIDNSAVVVEKASTGDQRLAFNSPSEDVAVTTQITGLEEGKDYVAEVYVDNESDAKASIEVNTGDATVSNYTMRSIAANYVKSDQKHGTNMQRMQISFTAEGETAELTLSRAAGEGSTYVDDIRIVQQTVENFDENGNFTQDFESVVQGLYPFVLGSAQGVSDPVTHLAELHAPYTQMGWQNKKATDDVIDGNWSVKHHGANTGIIYQTIPQNFRFEAGKVYTVEFDYQSGPDKAYAMVVGDGTSYTLPTNDQYLAQARGETQHVTMQVIGSGSGQTWIGLYENGSRANGNTATGENDFILDNLKITLNEDAVAVSIDKTELYVGETAQLYGSNLDKVTITSDNEDVVTIDPETLVVSAVGAGTATITAAISEEESTEFQITVMDGVIVDIADQLDMSAGANTEETGTAAYAVDGDTSTRWHSNWSTTGFNVNPGNPAILTIDLGDTVSFGGFKFMQRNDGNVNGVIYQYRYTVLDADNNEVYASDSITVPQELRTSAAWVTTQFPETLTGRYLVLYVEQGGNNFASLQEVVPFVIQKVADSVTLTDTTINVGETAVLEPGHAEGTLLKGLVWNSSDKATVSVDQNGNVTGLKAGTAVISVSNAAGLYAECTVTVLSDEPVTEISTAILEYAIGLAEEVNMDGVMDAVKENFDNALQTAKDVLARVQSGDPTVTQNEVESAWQNLIEAMQYGEFKPGDKTALEKVIALAEQMNSELDKYLEAGKAEFTAALENAKEVYADGNAFQEDVDSAWQQLLDAMGNLRLIPNKDLLADLIAQAESLNAADYETESYGVMTAALAAAKAVFEDENATQDEVDAANADLKNAIDSLVAVSGSGDDQQGGSTGSDNAGGSTSGTDTGDSSQDQNLTGITAGANNTSSSGGATGIISSGNSAAKATKTGDMVNVFPFAAGTVLAAGAAVIRVMAKRKKR